jgi:hypothetical protein
MLPFNRLYTPQELQAASRLAPAELNAPVVDRPVSSRPAAAGRGRGLVALRQRLFGRAGLRRSAPSTT